MDAHAQTPLDHLLPGPSPSASARLTRTVLLVGAAAPAHAALAAAVEAAWPDALIDAVPTVTDLVFRLATDGLDLVLIDRAHVPDLPASLLELLERMEPQMRVLAVITVPPSATPAGGEGGVSVEDLPAWLRAHAQERTA